MIDWIDIKDTRRLINDPELIAIVLYDPEQNRVFNSEAAFVTKGYARRLGFTHWAQFMMPNTSIAQLVEQATDNR